MALCEGSAGLVGTLVVDISALHTIRQAVSPELSCGSASTFVLTADTSTSRNAQGWVLMIESETYFARSNTSRPAARCARCLRCL
jgi:hypothetical protein